jgi:uncharacterized coiled-coil DUF342 family protein
MKTQYLDPDTDKPIVFKNLAFDELRDLKYRASIKATRIFQRLHNLRRRPQKQNSDLDSLQREYARISCLISRTKQELVRRSQTPGLDKQPADHYEKKIARLRTQIEQLEQSLDVGEQLVKFLEDIVGEHVSPQVYRRIMTQFEEFRAEIAQPEQPFFGVPGDRKTLERETA